MSFFFIVDDLSKSISFVGWDWGPAFAAAGMRSVMLCSHVEDIVVDVAVRQDHNANGSVTILADIYLWASSRSFSNHDHIQEYLSLKVVSCDGTRKWNAFRHIHTKSPKTMHSIFVTLSPPIDLWWPWDLGDQPLYNVSVSMITTHQRSAESDDEMLNWKQESRQIARARIGIRKAELERRPVYDDFRLPRPNAPREIGEMFYVRVNGLPVFARGANVVPIGVGQREDRRSINLRNLVRMAKEANMNFLRVWGGGAYFENAFYEECDRSGILVWQEFMYACAMYPTDASFIHEAAEEARQQAARLVSHPSVILWGGNNEVEASLMWFKETKKNPERYRNDYRTLFVDHLSRSLHRVDPSAIYVDGSPSNGIDPRGKGGGAAKRWGNVADPSYGDIHWYNYNDNLIQIPGRGVHRIFPAARFVSEFGYMSLPSFETYASESGPGDWYVAAELMRWRTRHENGIEQIQRQIGMHFRDQSMLAVEQIQGIGERRRDATTIPKDLLAFQAFIYLSQLQQALIYEGAVSRWRIDKSERLFGTGGILYWQLNDVWAGPSWSSCNVDGRWKLLHHVAKRFYRPIAVFGAFRSKGEYPSNSLEAASYSSRDDEHVEVHVVNDLPRTFCGTLSVQGMSFDAKSPVDVITFVNASRIRVAPFDVVMAWRCPIDDLYRVSLDELEAKITLLRFLVCDGEVPDLDGEIDDVEIDARNVPMGLGIDSTIRCSEQYLSLTEPKDACFGKSNVVVEHVEWCDEDSSNLIVIDLRAMDGIAPHVALDSGVQGNFDKNLFHLLPWQQKRVHFMPKDPVVEKKKLLEDFEASLRISWLTQSHVSTTRTDRAEVF